MSKYTKKARELHWLFVPANRGLRIAHNYQNKQWRPHAEHVYNNPTTIFAHRGQRHEDGSICILRGHLPLFYSLVIIRSCEVPVRQRKNDELTSFNMYYPLPHPLLTETSREIGRCKGSKKLKSIQIFRDFFVFMQKGRQECCVDHKQTEMIISYNTLRFHVFLSEWCT